MKKINPEGNAVLLTREFRTDRNTVLNAASAIHSLIELGVLPSDDQLKSEFGKIARACRKEATVLSSMNEAYDIALKCTYLTDNTVVLDTANAIRDISIRWVIVSKKIQARRLLPFDNQGEILEEFATEESSPFRVSAPIGIKFDLSSIKKGNL